MGSLVHYSMICTQPDLSYVVTKLSQHLSKPNRSDYWVLLKHAFQYIKGSVNYCLPFQKGHLNLSAHCDADWASSLTKYKIDILFCAIILCYLAMDPSY